MMSREQTIRLNICLACQLLDEFLVSKPMVKRLILLVIISVLPLLLFAHGSHGNGVMSGFTHPIFGFDHAVAIFGAGVLAYLINPSRWYISVAAFVGAMIIGGLFGIGNEATVMVEKAIASSVLIIGILIMLRKRLNLPIVVFLLAIFGVFHGYAHGAEMDPENTALKYVSGYTLGAFLMGTIGMLAAKVINMLNNELVFTIVGAIISALGVMILLG